VRRAALAGALLALIPLGAAAQGIQRCEGPGGRVTYANDTCPEGTRPVRTVDAAPAPTPEAQQAARDKAARDAAAAQALSEQRRTQQAATAQRERDAQRQRESQRAADCAYLRGEIQSTYRMRNMLVNRPYYSLDDLAAMEQHAAQLTADYQRTCGR
jgi:uncharacterized iron-regulated membrane protein